MTDVERHIRDWKTGLSPAEASAASQITEGLKEALAVSRGEAPAARIYHNGHWYVPESAVAIERETVAVAAEKVAHALSSSDHAAARHFSTFAAAIRRGVA